MASMQLQVAMWHQLNAHGHNAVHTQAEGLLDISYLMAAHFKRTGYTQRADLQGWPRQPSSQPCHTG